MKLISMTDFVLDKAKEDFNNGEYPEFNFRDLVWNYADFLKQPLTLGMFVPCDEEGNVLEELKYCCDGNHCGCNGMPVNVCSKKEIDNYQKAKERVLFDGFEIDENNILMLKDCISLDINSFNNIEELITYGNTQLTLTENAIKQIGI